MKIVTLLLVLFLFTTSISFSQWEAVNNGITENYINRLAISGSNIVAGSYTGSIFLSTDNGNNWSMKYQLTDNTNIMSMVIAESNIYVSNIRSDLLISHDKGNNWEFNIVNDSINSISALLINNGTVYISTNHGIFLSTNNGIIWSKKNTGLTDTFTISLGKSGKNIYTGTQNNGIFMLSDNGDDWVPKNNGLITKRVTMIKASANNIFAIALKTPTTPVMYLSTDSGENWLEKKISLHNSLLCIEPCDTSIFAGTDYGGAFFSIDRGNTWLKKNYGLNNLAVRALVSNNEFIFAGTEAGVFRAKLSDIMTSVEETQKDFSNLIYPNPASDMININTENSIGREIKIIDVLGNQVISKSVESDLTTVNIESLPKGVYFLQIDNKKGMFCKY